MQKRFFFLRYKNNHYIILYFKYILLSGNYTDNGSDTSYKLMRSSISYIKGSAYVIWYLLYLNILFALWGGGGHNGHDGDCMVVGSTTTYAISVSPQVLSLNLAHG